MSFRSLAQAEDFDLLARMDHARQPHRQGIAGGPFRVQNRKSSMRAYVFRFAPHRAMQSACPFRATFGLMQRSKISWLFDRFCNTVHTNRSPAHSTLRTGTKPQRGAVLVYRLRKYSPPPRSAFNTDH